MNGDASSVRFRRSSSVDDDYGLQGKVNVTTTATTAATEALMPPMHNSTSTPAELVAQIAVGAVLSTLCLITVLGNTLVIHAVRTDRKLQTVGI